MNNLRSRKQRFGGSPLAQGSERQQSCGVYVGSWFESMKPNVHRISRKINSARAERVSCCCELRRCSPGTWAGNLLNRRSVSCSHRNLHYIIDERVTIK